MSNKQTTPFAWFTAIIAALVILVLLSLGYRIHHLATTDWKSVLTALRPIDYVIALLATASLIFVRKA